jgi:hypothetical protein
MIWVQIGCRCGVRIGRINLPAVIVSIRILRERELPMNPGKGLCEPCIICGEDRLTERAHFPMPKKKPFFGGDTIALCPTHHRLLDRGRLSDWELMEICRKRYPNLQFSTSSQFVEWAHKQGYPYSFTRMKAKTIHRQYQQPRQISYRIENEGELASFP